MRKTALPIIAGLCITTISACAQTKKATAVQAGTAYAKLVECAEQTTLPGRPEMEPTTTKRIVLVWKSTNKPETFFWRGEDGWTECAISKVSKNKTSTKPKYQFGENWYTTTDISPEKIRKGDTIELIPVYGGKTPVPEAITPQMTNRLFFKTKANTWLYVPVKSCIKRPDIAMP